VDDRAPDRELAATLLVTRLGCSVLEAADGVAFAEHLAEGAFDAVVVERRLDWGDGERVARAVRRRLPRVPVVCFSEVPPQEAAPAADSPWAAEVVKGSGGYLELPGVVDALLTPQAAVSDVEGLVRALSHDLQEPAQLVARYARLVGERYGDALDEEGRRHVGHLEESARRMQSMIQQVLDYARLGAPAARAPVPLDEAVDEALANLGSALEESGGEVVRNGGLPTVHANRAQMVRLFQNLIGNAVKFRAKDPPHVEVTAEAGEGRCTVAVADNGIGIAPADRERVFELFRRLHPASRYPGTGIGLAEARRIAEAHGGTIRLESAPGRGSTFFVDLPGGGE
jgi:signal transduction histidine kinase